MLRKLLIVAGAIVVMLPVPARADWLFTPSLGRTFGADTHGKGHTIFGGAAGWIDYDGFGWEADVSFAPDFFEGDHDDFMFTGDSEVATLMFNGVIGDLSAVRQATGLRPYLTGGIGMIRVHVITESAAARFDSKVTEFAYNIGGGVVAFLGEHVGLRADLRYLRSFEDDPPSWTIGEGTFDIAPGKFDFFRGTIGLTLRLPN
jgi:hypothetical protein